MLVGVCSGRKMDVDGELDALLILKGDFFFFFLGKYTGTDLFRRHPSLSFSQGLFFGSGAAASMHD